jgi:MinD-like ATPase involved in chromosome partitioning or flagellar assembly
MRKQPDDDLASALPSSLTVDLHLPEPIHEAPLDEKAIAIDDVAVTPAGDSPATRSIPIVMSAVEIAGDTEALVPGATDTAESEPDEIVPLPEVDEVTPIVTRSRRAPKPSKPGRRPRPEGRVAELVYAATLHLVNLGDSAPVRARKALDARIARPFADGARFIPVLSRKGGVGKTTITVLLGMALADVREDRVLAIDANPDRGTLADRVTKQTRSTVRDVVWHAPDLADFDELATHVSRDITGLDVAASDADPLLADAFDDGGFNVVADVVAPHYGVIVTDSGTGVVHSVMRAALQRADAVVVVSGGSVDEARLASETLTWLEANHYGHLVANAVVALNASTQGTDLDKIADIEQHFRSRVRAVARIPYDPELAAGSVVRYEALRPFTRASARELAALVMDGLAPESTA